MLCRGPEGPASPPAASQGGGFMSDSRSVARVLIVVACGLLLAAPTARADDPSVRERVYGNFLAERLGDGAGQVERVSHDGARGVRVSLPGLTAERLRFRSAAAAEAFARALGGGGPGLVEVRGDQALVARGPRLADPQVARQVSGSGWEVLPAPARAPSLVRDLATPTAAAQPAATRSTEVPTSTSRPEPRPTANQQGAGARPVNDTHGAVELLDHHLLGEELRELRPGTAHDTPAGPTGRTAVAEAVTAASPRAMGAHQRERVLPAYDALTPAERQAFDELLARHAKEPAVRDQLLKALAAGSPPSELEWLAGELAGRDPAWIEANTRLTAPDTGAGLRQQFQDSCAATTVQALRGEYDPAYALRTRQSNGDVTQAPASGNDPFAREQRTILESNGGLAVPREQQGGAGLRDPDWLAALEAVGEQSGLRFTQVGSFDAPIEPERAIALMEENLSQGRVVPLGLSDPVAPGGHAIMATSVRRDAKGQPEFLVFDPWEGWSGWITAAAIRDVKVDVAGWNLIDTVMVPSPASGS